MASIHKHRDKWLVRWRDRDNTNRSRSCPDRTTAGRLQREIEAAQALGRDWQPEAPREEPPRLQVIAEAYVVARARVLRPRTLERYAEMLDAWLGWAAKLDTGELSALSLAGLERYWDHLVAPTGRHGRPRTPSTAAKHLEVVSLCWSWAWSRSRAMGWDRWVPPPEELDMPKRQRPLVLAPSWAEADAMIAQLERGTWTHRLAWLQRCAGLRVGEALRVRWADLVDDVLHVQAEDTKGGYGGRALPLAPVLLAEISTWPRTGPTLVEGPAAELTGRGHVQRNMARAWRRAGVRVEVYAGRPTHALRKAFSTGVRLEGGAGELVEIYTGHAIPGSGRAYVDPALLVPQLRALAALVPPVKV